MDPKFFDYVRRQIEMLLEDEESGVGPRNPDLRDAVYRVLRSQFRDSTQH